MDKQTMTFTSISETIATVGSALVAMRPIMNPDEAARAIVAFRKEWNSPAVMLADDVGQACGFLKVNLDADSTRFGDNQLFFVVVDEAAGTVEVTSADMQAGRARRYRAWKTSTGIALIGTAPDTITPDRPSRGSPSPPPSPNSPRTARATTHPPLTATGDDASTPPTGSSGQSPRFLPNPSDGPTYGREGTTSTVAIFALVFAFVIAPVGIVLGLVGRRQIRRTGESGWGLATAGLAVGCAFTLLGVIGLVTAGIVGLARTPVVEYEVTGSQRPDQFSVTYYDSSEKRVDVDNPEFPFRQTIGLPSRSVSEHQHVSFFAIGRNSDFTPPHFICRIVVDGTVVVEQSSDSHGDASCDWYAVPLSE